MLVMTTTTKKKKKSNDKAALSSLPTTSRMSTAVLIVVLCCLLAVAMISGADKGESSFSIGGIQMGAMAAAEESPPSDDSGDVQEEMTCDPQDGSCSAAASAAESSDWDKTKEFQVTCTNESPYRADIYWDDGRFGKFLVTMERGESTIFNTHYGHRFMVTRHGVRENLFDLESDTPYIFTTTYPSQILLIPNTAAPSPHPCQDRFGICPHEAARGSCHENPGWMIVNCCKSCDPHLEASKLINPKIRCSPEHLNMTGPIWNPGDLNQLFEEWATSDAYQQYDPKVWSSPDGNSYNIPATGGDSAVPKGPWVMTFDNFFTADEAQALIQGGRTVGFDRSTDQGQVNAAGEMEKVVSKTRTSSNAWCVGACEQMPQVQAVTARIEQVTHIPKTHYESFQILEYGHNQFYRSHHDSSNRKDDSPAGHRILTFFLYLSDVEEGGETYFNRLNLAVKPKLGRALVWPSVLNDQPDLWDPRMFHEAKDVVKGTKYAANHWIHLNDYVTPNIWGCTGSFS